MGIDSSNNTNIGTSMKVGQVEARRVPLDNRINVPKSFQKFSPFLIGGFAGITATTIVQPIDMVKVHVQLLPLKRDQAHSVTSVIFNIFKTSGVKGFYKGLDAGVLRQITYSTSRLGIYKTLSDHVKDGKDVPLSFIQSSAIGFVSGALAALIGNPTEVSLIRLQTDQTLPKELRRCYTGVLNALCRIVKEEGPTALYKGAYPTLARAAALNAAMMVSFDKAKEYFRPYLSKNQTLLVAASISSFFAVICSYPLDVAKTKIQRMKADPITGKYPYTGMVQCMKQTYMEGGFRGFYVGWPTYYFRIAPHVVITWLIWDSMHDVVKNYIKYV